MVLVMALMIDMEFDPLSHRINRYIIQTQGQFPLLEEQL